MKKILTFLLPPLLLMVLLSSGSALEIPSGQAVEVSLKGLVCDFCAQALQKVFAKRPEVLKTSVNLSTKKMTIEFQDGQTLDDQTIAELVKKAGYAVAEIKR